MLPSPSTALPAPHCHHHGKPRSFSAECSPASPSSLEDDEDDDEFDAPILLHPSVKDTSGSSASSDDEEEEADDDGCSSSASSITTPGAHAINTGAPSTMRRVVRPSSRQHKLSLHYTAKAAKFNAVNIANRGLSQRIAHRRKFAQQQSQHEARSTKSVVTLPISEADKSEPVPEPKESTTALSPSATALLVAILRRSDGRDKLLRTALFAINTTRAVAQLPLVRKVALGKFAPVAGPLDYSFQQFSDALSDSRQLLRLGRWLYGAQSVKEAYQEWQRSREIANDSTNSDDSSPSFMLLSLDFVNSFFGFAIDILDDVEWLGERKVLPENVGETAGSVSAVLWLLTLCIDVPLTVAALAQIAKSRGQPLLANAEFRAESLSLARYCSDFVYALWLVRPKRISNGLANAAGLASGAVSLWKLTQSQSLHRSLH